MPQNLLSAAVVIGALRVNITCMKLPGKPLDADGFHEFNFDDNCQKRHFSLCIV